MTGEPPNLRNPPTMAPSNRVDCKAWNIGRALSALKLKPRLTPERDALGVKANDPFNVGDK